MARKPGNKDDTHRRIVDTAARAFRAQGVDAVGVAALMQQAGLTHGGFYAHFASKAALVAEAIPAAARQSAGRLQTALSRGRPGRSGLTRLLRSYLSPAHQEQADRGCFLAALGSELTRADPAARRAATAAIEDLWALIERELPAGAGRRDRALATLAGMVGALTLSRIVDDPALARRLLRATAQALDPPVP